MHVAQSDKLYPILQELYIALYKQDLFKRNFEGTRLYNVRVLPTVKPDSDDLKESDLLNPKFLKCKNNSKVYLYLCEGFMCNLIMLQKRLGNYIRKK
jgi:hypothetical protein